MEFEWDTILEYYSRNRHKIEADARSQLHQGTSVRIIAHQHQTYLLARQHSPRTDVEIPLLDRMASRLRQRDRRHK